MLTEIIKKLLTKCSEQIDKLLIISDKLDLVALIFAILLPNLGIFYIINSSHAWVIKHVGINSRYFMDIEQINHNLTIDFNYTAHFDTIKILEQDVNKYTYSSNIFLGIFILIFVSFTVFTWIKYRNVKVTVVDKDFENSLISIIGTFLGISFGLSTGGYLLLCSSVTDYYNQLFLFSAMGIPYDKLPFESWNAFTQIIDYIGFLIVSIITFLCLLTRICFIKSSCKAWKSCSDNYVFASIGLSVIVFYIFFTLSLFY